MAPEAEASVEAEETYEPLAEQLKVLGNAKRLGLLHLLTKPHYIQEIASELGMARQSAQAHVDKLLEIGVIERRRGRRESGPVTDFVVVPHRLFSIQEAFAQVGRLEPEVAEEDVRMLTEVLEETAPGKGGDPVSRLIVVHGMRMGERTQLTGAGPWLIGRDPSAQLCLDYDPFVSTRHAEVRRRDEGGYEVADLYSRNGTRVDWEPVPRGQAVELVPGAVIGFGRTLVVFRRPG